ncbi:MAG: efflux RND transporter periplasmic adaptor subunit [Cyclobacteriaceae bacterium]|nr:efflux RND transporter periplasmic adaptor subunit [Cyclobacteriaceae bacterium]
MNRSIHYLLILVVGLTACSKFSQVNDEPASMEEAMRSNVLVLTDEQVKKLSLEFGKIEKHTLGATVKVNGVLDVPPQNLVTISAPLGGFIRQTELLQGMKIKKGQLLALMEHPDYIQLQQDYLEAKDQLELLELEYKRQQELAAENVNATKTLEQAKSNYNRTKVKTEGLKARLAMVNITPSALESGTIKQTISITSPISGYVSQVNVNLGMYVSPTDVMFKIVDTDHLHAEVQVFEKDITKLKIGHRMRFTLVNESVERIADVYLIGKEISLERTVRVHCHLKEEDSSLIPGMYFSGVIEVGDTPVLAVKSEAIVNFEGKDYLFVLKPKNTFELVEIKAGVTDAGFTEVMLPEGFDVSASIVIQGTYTLISQLKNTEE